MNKNDCLLKIRSRKLLSAVETTDNHEITLVIKLVDKVMKQSQFDILIVEINKINTKIDEMKVKLKAEINEVKTNVKEIKLILKKHDDLFVEHGWLNESSFE